MNDSERVGREIWYKATAGNARFHSYTMPQRLGVYIDWYRVLNAGERDDRFRAWGTMNDPSCCIPGKPGCPAKSLDQTYGLEWCPGDEELLKFVGKEGYRDPACSLTDTAVDLSDTHGPKDQRQSACDLAFGTSTGVLGLRKFPNPRFNAATWKKLNGSFASWNGWRQRLPRQSPGGKLSQTSDDSVEPPFLIGQACGLCHISFDPLNPPKNPSQPKWENLKGGIGNQYIRVSELLGSGMPTNSLEWQMFAHARPGTTDTSAIPSDQTNNPGTINAIINLKQRPIFANEKVIKWRKVQLCAKDAPAGSCWCEPGRDNKCWQRGEREEAVNHILKGGEDSIGAPEAVQRVYFNIGSCSEQCWVNHLTDLRQLDPQARNFGQTPFNIGQCRRDCPNFRAIEDRLPNIVSFLMSKENNATDLFVARKNERKQRNAGANYGYDDLVADLEKEFGKGAVGRGHDVFAQNCARCHSSIPENVGGPFKNRDFRALDPQTGLRADWMGNDGATKVSEVGTYRCRALHANHMTGHIYQEYGSETLRARPSDPNVREDASGGRGYYRNISLLSVWAHAPLMHNNAMGPEICGKPANKANDFDRPRYIDADGKMLPPNQQPACWAYDPSVDGRFKLYKESMHQLLNPQARKTKATLFNEEVNIAFGPKLWDGDAERELLGLTLTIPAGTKASGLGNFLHKRFIGDLVIARLRPAELQTQLVQQYGDKEGKELTALLQRTANEVMKNPTKLVDIIKREHKLLEIYSSCTDTIENGGHTFGQDLPDADKKALTAFLATL
ncbi:MAG: cytochrome c [Gammaproteobacteria bacterium]|nr:cytochrome c [Gammaproteobacteria bacterium]